VIAKNDMIEALLSDTAWQGQRIKFVQAWSKAHDSFWLAEYARIRRSFDRSVVGDKARAEREAAALYASRRGEADEGCVISWEERYRKPEELSAIQHAYNVLIDDGPEVFASEYQNEPLDPRAAAGRLTAPMVMAKTNGLARGVVPKVAEFVTAYVDVHARVLYYVVAGWASDMTGAVLDYGTFPRQPLSYFAQATAPATMAAAFPGMNEDAWLQGGLTILTDGLLAGSYRREDSAGMGIAMMLIDARWGEKNALVKQFVRRHPQFGTRLMAAQGYGSGGTRQTLNSFVLKPGTREGPGWRIAPPTAGDRWVTIDTNLNKSRTAGQLATPLGCKGGIELFGMDPREHQLFADHCIAEAPVEVTGRGVTLDVWEWLLPHSDNHWWDCLVGCGVAASILGCRIPGTGEVKKRKRVRLSQLQAAR
jgi:phage terminase large subunit GpA-like protein